MIEAERQPRRNLAGLRYRATATPMQADAATT